MWIFQAVVIGTLRSANMERNNTSTYTAPSGFKDLRAYYPYNNPVKSGEYFYLHTSDGVGWGELKLSVSELMRQSRFILGGS